MIPQGHRWTFKATSGGVLDDGPAFYAPQLLAEPDRTLMWGWAWELRPSALEFAEVGWAGVLTFPRELFVRDGQLGTRPATELAELRRASLALRPGVPFEASAFELMASGPVALRLIADGVDSLVAAADGTPTDPARILVDGSIVETFHRSRSCTTRAYPTMSSSWVAEGAAVTAYRLGHKGPDAPAAADLRRSFAVQQSRQK
jgi:beta-fructofuranosidase